MSGKIRVFCKCVSVPNQKYHPITGCLCELCQTLRREGKPDKDLEQAKKVVSAG